MEIDSSASSHTSTAPLFDAGLLLLVLGFAALFVGLLDCGGCGFVFFAAVAVDVVSRS